MDFSTDAYIYTVNEMKGLNNWRGVSFDKFNLVTVTLQVMPVGPMCLVSCVRF